MDDKERLIQVIRDVDILKTERIHTAARQERFEQTFEKLTDAFVGLDKKLDVFIANTTENKTVKASSMDWLFKIIPMAAAVIMGMITYDQQTTKRISEAAKQEQYVTAPPVVQIPQIQYRK